MNEFRSGVFTSYSLVASPSQTNRVVVGVLVAGQVTPMQEIASLTQAKTIFGDGLVAAVCNAIFAHGAATIQVLQTDDYPTGLSTLLAKTPSVIVTDCTDTETLQQLTAHLETQSKKGKTAILLTTVADSTEAKDLASAVNNARCCVATPAILSPQGYAVTAAILAGIIATSMAGDVQLNGALVAPSYQVTTLFSDQQLQELFAAGVCVFQQVGATAELMRGLTTKTTDETGQTDVRFRNLAVVLIADRVVSAVQTLLQEKLLHNSGGKVTLDAVLSLIVCLLEEFVATGQLTSYQQPLLYTAEEDVTVCHVELSFGVRQGIYQVYLHAVVTV